MVFSLEVISDFFFKVRFSLLDRDKQEIFKRTKCCAFLNFFKRNLTISDFPFLKMIVCYLKTSNESTDMKCIFITRE